MLNDPPDPKLTEKSHLNSAHFIYYISSEPDFTSCRPVRKKLQISVKSTDFEPITNGKKIPTIVAIIIVFLS